MLLFNNTIHRVLQRDLSQSTYIMSLTTIWLSINIMVEGTFTDQEFI